MSLNVLYDTIITIWRDAPIVAKMAKYIILYYIILYYAIEIEGTIYRVKSTVRRVNQGDRYYTYEIQEMELLEDTQEASGLLNIDNGRQLNSNNSITGAKLLKGVMNFYIKPQLGVAIGEFDCVVSY